VATKDLVERLRDWAIWYHEHKKDPRSVPQQVAFNNTMIDGMMELMALMIGELIEHRGQQLDGNVLWTPERLARLDRDRMNGR